MASFIEHILYISEFWHLLPLLVHHEKQTNYPNNQPIKKTHPAEENLAEGNKQKYKSWNENYLGQQKLLSNQKGSL